MNSTIFFLESDSIMPEIRTRYLEEAILQLLREKAMIEHENRFYYQKLDPNKKQELLTTINMELGMMIEQYTEQTGKTFNEFLTDYKKEKAKEREKNKFTYI